MSKYSFGLLKPDALERRVDSDIFAAIASFGLQVTHRKQVRLTAEQASTIWGPCVGKWFWDDMLAFVTTSDVIVFLVKGDGAIERLNILVGHYDPAEADEFSIRHSFGTSPMHNVIHSSLDCAAFLAEVRLFFTDVLLQP